MPPNAFIPSDPPPARSVWHSAPHPGYECVLWNIYVRLCVCPRLRWGAAEQVWFGNTFALTGRASAEQLQAFANGQEPLDSV